MQSALEEYCKLTCTPKASRPSILKTCLKRWAEPGSSGTAKGDHGSAQAALAVSCAAKGFRILALRPPFRVNREMYV